MKYVNVNVNVNNIISAKKIINGVLANGFVKCKMANI